MSLSDWDSDLTELDSSSDEDYAPQKKKRGRPVKEYQITDFLTPPRPANYSTRSIYDLLVSGQIDLDPQYQRGVLNLEASLAWNRVLMATVDVVWPETKQAGLIDSMLRNYYIPPVIFACKYDPETQQMTRVCIDGKQRLTSIRKFFDGEIARKYWHLHDITQRLTSRHLIDRDSITGKKYWYKNTSGTKRPMLSQNITQSFKLKQIVCVEYDHISEEQEREIFQRVQLGVALTPAERMQAISGPWPDLIREIQSVTIGEEGFADALEWGSARGRDFQCLATIVYLIQGNPKFPHTSQMEKWLQNTNPVPAKLRTDILETFKIFVRLARDQKYTGCFQKPSRISPVEFIMTGVCIYTLREKFSFLQLSSAIAKMREDVRSKHVDIRSNPKVMKTMQTFLKKVQPSALKSDPNDKTPAAAAMRSFKGGNLSTKRKRTDDTDDDEPRIPTAGKASKSLKKGKAEPKASNSSKSLAKESHASGSKTIVKKVAAPVSKKVSAPASRGSAMEPPASKVSSSMPQSAKKSRQSTSTSTSPHPPLSSLPTSEATTPISHATLNQQSIVDTARRGSEEVLLPSIGRRPTANGFAAQSSSSAEVFVVQQVAIKPDPDLDRPRSGTAPVLDRLAVIRNAKISPDRTLQSPTATTPSQAITSAVPQEHSSQQIPPTTTLPDTAQPSATYSTSTPQDRPPLLPPPTMQSALQNNAANMNEAHAATTATAPSQVTAAQVRSILANAGYSAAQLPERRSSVDVIPNRGDANAFTRDPRRRPSTSPNQTFFTPGFTSGRLSVGGAGSQGSPQPPPTAGSNDADGQSSTASTPAADPGRAPSGIQAETPSSTASAAQSLSPTLPKRPDIMPKAQPSSTDVLAVQINPHRLSAEIPKGPRADREREREWSGGYYGRDGSKRSRWDQREAFDSPGRDRGWRGGSNGGGPSRDPEYGWRS